MVAGRQFLFTCTSKRGFGLIEFLIALAVIAILAGLGAPGFAGVAGKSRVTGEAAALLNAIELARSEATKRGRRVTLLPIRGDWAGGWVVFVDDNGNRLVDTGESVILRHAPFHPTTRVTADTTPGYIAFAASGMPQQYSGAFLAGTLAFCNTGHGRSVVVAKSGRPRLVTSNC